MSSQKAAPLNLSVRFVRSIGVKKAVPFEKAGVRTLRDLLLFFPRRYLDRTHTTQLNSLQGPSNGEITVIGTIADTREVKAKGKTRYEAILEDGSGGAIKLVWFRRTNQIKKWIKFGYTAAFSGVVKQFGFELQMAHPEVTYLSKGEAEDLKSGSGRWVALYPGGKEFENAGLDARGLRKLMERIIGEFGNSITEMWSTELLNRFNLMPIREALNAVHRPHNQQELEKGLERFKFDELVFLQLMWGYTRYKRKQKESGIAYPQVGDQTRDLINKKLPFDLTNAQKRVLREIWNDMTSPHPMSRLLQGDVGSGKTVVALIAMSIAVENGYQAALMAPTEILAEQHYLTSRKFLEGLGVQVYLLTGSTKAAERKEILPRLDSGEPCIVIGTHAIIQDSVILPNLGLTVIDEQHRFGVAQRQKLMDPGLKQKPDVLVMTATPIPRSLALTMYGDLEVSRLDEMPPGRGKITTQAINGDNQRDDLYRRIRKRLEKGGRAYIIFPLVEESEKLDLQAAVEGREELINGPLKGLPVELLHGRMKMDEKEAAMQKFASGQAAALVSTTVVEVGVDVPEATEMVIEHSERFGLSQLHQLRGRVGRGGNDSRCYLVGYPPVTEVARSRIKTMINTLDGFVIAEEDLRLRGSGDVFGTRQHGMPELKFADIVNDQQLLMRARHAADELINKDVTLRTWPELREAFQEMAKDKMQWIKVG